MADLTNRLARANEDFTKYGKTSSNYVRRALIYAQLSYRTDVAEDKAFYIQEALADLDKAVEISPHDTDALTQRARFRMSLDLLSWFDAIVADYLKVIEISEKYREDKAARFPYAQEGIGEGLAEVYGMLSHVYLSRAESILKSQPPTVRIRPQPVPYYLWDDFDSATKYAQKAVIKSFDLMKVIQTRIAKGDAAYREHEYALALAAYQSDEQYLGKDYALLCENEGSKQWCASHQSDLTLMFSIRRGRVYLKLRQPAKALAEFAVYFAKAPHLECSDIFSLRAVAYRQLGKDELASADEEQAGKWGSAKCPFDVQRH